MNAQSTKITLVSMLWKGVCLLLVGLLTLIGLAGLILPIIPGVLFLILAALLLAKVSSRFETLLQKNEQLKKWRRRWNASSALPFFQRLKLSFLLVAKAVIDGLETTANSLNKVRADS